MGAVHRHARLAESQRIGPFDKRQRLRPVIGSGEAKPAAAAAQRLVDREASLVFPHLQLPHVLLQQEGGHRRELRGWHLLPLLEAGALTLGAGHVEVEQRFLAEVVEDPGKAVGHEAHHGIVQCEVSSVLGVEEADRRFRLVLRQRLNTSSARRA